MRRRTKLVNLGTTALELAGLGAVTYGIWQIWPPAAWIFAGIAAIGMSFLLVWKGSR